MTTFSNLVDPSLYDQTAMTNKQNLINALQPFTASMCKGFSVGEPAGKKIKLNFQ